MSRIVPDFEKSFSASQIESDMNKKITIRDVAQRTGVSIATVSRVLSNRRSVRVELAGKVLEAARELEYLPSAPARNLRRGRSHTVGLILSDVSNPFFGNIVRGSEEVLNGAGYGAAIFNTDNTVEKERLAIQRVMEMHVDGVIVSSASREGQHFERLRRAGIHLVFVNREPDNAADDSVVSDNEGGAAQGVTFLIKQGHSRIGIVCGPQRYSTARRRQMGYHKALVDAGLPLVTELIVEAQNTSFDSGLQCIRKLLARPSRPTAIFVTNNTLTLGVVRGLRDAGLRIPEEMAVVGFDDPEWAALFGLSTVMQPTHEMGASAARLLIKRMEDAHMAPQRIVLETHLVVRASTSPRQEGDEGHDSTTTIPRH
jgi:LacI family transcriptional regulator